MPRGSGHHQRLLVLAAQAMQLYLLVHGLVILQVESVNPGSS